MTPPDGEGGDGAEVRAARVAAGWTQAELAARLGVSRQFVAAVEAGRKAAPAGLAERAGALARPDEEPEGAGGEGRENAPDVAAGMAEIEAAIWQTADFLEEGLKRIEAAIRESAGDRAAVRKLADRADAIEARLDRAEAGQETAMGAARLVGQRLQALERAGRPPVWRRFAGLFRRGPPEG